jgi:hypothetical protein
MCSEKNFEKMFSNLKLRKWRNFLRSYFQAWKQGCQMVCFRTKNNPNVGKFWRALDWKMLIYFMATWNILWRFRVFYDHLLHFVFIWYSFPVLVSRTKKNLATLLGNSLGSKISRSERRVSG